MQTWIGASAIVLVALTASGAAAAPAGGRAAPAGIQESTPGLAPFAEHLRFLGYEVTDTGKLLKAAHERRLSFTLSPVSGGVLLLAYFEGKEDVLDTPHLEFVQKLNKEATCARYYWDDEFDLIVEAWFPGEHDQHSFATFMEGWDADGDRIFAAPGLTDLVK